MFRGNLKLLHTLTTSVVNVNVLNVACKLGDNCSQTAFIHHPSVFIVVTVTSNLNQDCLNGSVYILSDSEMSPALLIWTWRVY